MAKRSDSSRSSGGYHNRTINKRQQKLRFLIVCQGAKTERTYFGSFPEIRRQIQLNIKPLAVTPIEMVECTARLWNDDGYRKGDQAWCVFDKDETPPEHFNAAIALAKQWGIQVAYSNEAFELWYLLHFQYIDSAVSRADYVDKLSAHLGMVYKKNDSNMYGRLVNRQKNAIANAERLCEQHDHSDPARENPSTTVHLLVKELNRFLN